MWRTKRTREKKENYFIFLANCYKRTFGDDIVFEEKRDNLFEYGKHTKAYQFIGKYSTYNFLKPQEIINFYLNKNPKADMMGNNKVFIVFYEFEKKICLVYYSHEKKEWQEISYDELINYNIGYKNFEALYEHFKNFIDDYNNDKITSYMEEKYLTHPIKIGEQD